MTATDTLTASLEDYLEAIFQIISEKEAVRPKDIARRLSVSNSSVTGALRSLAERRLINYAPYDIITLTSEGKTVARDVARRHEILRDFFVNVLAIEPSDADIAACKMEHSIPRSILNRFVQFAEFTEVCPRGGEKWISGFGHYCDQGGARENCEVCVSVTLEEVRQRREKEKDRDRSADPITLDELKPGRKGRVLKTSLRGEAGKGILELGITPGAVVEVERIARSGEPIEIKVKGYHLSLRKDDAEGIEIEAL